MQQNAQAAGRRGARRRPGRHDAARHGHGGDRPDAEQARGGRHREVPRRGRAREGASDGSYVVHVIQSNGDGEVHVLVSKDFEVTGVQQGGPPAGATGGRRPPSPRRRTGSDDGRARA